MTGSAIEKRLQALEDRAEIQQMVCGYGYAADGMRGDFMAGLYAEDGVYAVSDSGAFRGKKAIADIVDRPTHLNFVNAGCAHLSSPPYIVIEGDKATATCHTAVLTHGENGFFIARLSASRLELSRKAGGGWQIDHRQNEVLLGDRKGSRLLGRLDEALRPA